jgi:hypothetical protein
VTPAPDAAQLLAVCKQWTGDAALVSQIVVANPSALYA